MTVERTFQGAWRISTIHKGQYITRQYFGYTKKETIQEFTGVKNNMKMINKARTYKDATNENNAWLTACDRDWETGIHTLQYRS